MKLTLSGVLSVVLLQGLLTAQVVGPQAPGKPTVVPIVPAKPEPPSTPAAADAPNIKLELRITDTYSGSPVEKTVSMLVLSGRNGRVRTSNWVESDRPELKGMFSTNDPNLGRELVQLNVDAVATALARDQIETRVTFEYRPAPPAGATGRSLPAALNESLHIMLKSGQPLVVSQSADPATDRKVTVQLVATILR